jgi:hypothetical protein
MKNERTFEVKNRQILYLDCFLSFWEAFFSFWEAFLCFVLCVLRQVLTMLQRLDRTHDLPALASWELRLGDMQLPPHPAWFVSWSYFISHSPGTRLSSLHRLFIVQHYSPCIIYYDLANTFRAKIEFILVNYLIGILKTNITCMSWKI